MRYINANETNIFRSQMEALSRAEMTKKEKLGIYDNGYGYHIIGWHQFRADEFLRTEDFLKRIVENNPNVFDKCANICFIAYGDTELVYVVDECGYKRTLLVGQPKFLFGIVRKEYENLIKLAKTNPDLVVCPTNYFSIISDIHREAYLTPYFYQARGIVSSEEGYGAHVPELNYGFVAYSEEDTYTICKSIIASLILLYNQDENLGIASCKIGRGDFILEKEYDTEEHTIENTLKRMHLTAARELISVDLNTYINLIKSEFRQITYYDDFIKRNPNILINYKNRIPMTRDAIEDGIELGLRLRK